MNLQYISDNLGNKTAVIIPISEWDLLTKQYKITEKENIYTDIPNWQKEIVLKRLEAIKQNPNLLIDEKQFWKEIEDEN
jgi:hypothetical protein